MAGHNWSRLYQLWPDQLWCDFYIEVVAVIDKFSTSKGSKTVDTGCVEQVPTTRGHN